MRAYTIVTTEVLRALADVLARPKGYLDPGSGSYLLQLLIAAALGGLFALRIYWKRVKGFLLKLFGRGEQDGED